MNNVSGGRQSRHPVVSADVIVNAAGYLQTMDGFGAADVFLDALSDAHADLFFDVSTGIGLSILRIGINTSGTIMSAYSNPTKAAARGAKIWAAPWTAPGALKDNGSDTN